MTAEQGYTVDLLHKFVAARNAATVYGREKDAIGAEIKAWLEQHPEEVLLDGERGITAQLQERSLPGRTADFNALWDNNQRLFEQLVRNGCLRIDMTALKAAGPLVAGIERYLAPAGKTAALEVKEQR